MNPLGRYVNGNYTVILFDDGTKIRVNNKASFTPAFPESMDIKISNQCDMGCEMCHEDSTPDGRHGDIMGAEFINNLHPYTELAIGGGNPLTHPDLDRFLAKCKELRLIPNMTVNQVHFMKEYDRLKRLTDEKLIYGLGVSMREVNGEFLDKVKTIPNTVIHVIAGIVEHEQLACLYDMGLKILILGYKQFRRGNVYFDANKQSVMERIEETASHLEDYFNHFKVVSFDNLAIKQLGVKDKLSEDNFNMIYMGDDGQYTMYVDLVSGVFAKSSTAMKRWSIEGHNTIETMFEQVRKEL